jgi:hypothetical protein
MEKASFFVLGVQGSKNLQADRKILVCCFGCEMKRTYKLVWRAYGTLAKLSDKEHHLIVACLLHSCLQRRKFLIIAAGSHTHTCLCVCLSLSFSLSLIPLSVKEEFEKKTISCKKNKNKNKKLKTNEMWQMSGILRR